MALNNDPDFHWTGQYRLGTKTDNDGNVVGGGLVLPGITTTERDALDSTLSTPDWGWGRDRARPSRDEEAGCVPCGEGVCSGSDPWCGCSERAISVRPVS